MKILHVISSPAAGGAEMYIKDLAKNLVSQGHSVHIGFLDRASDTGRSAEFAATFLAELETAGIRYFFIGHDARKFPWKGAVHVRSYVKEADIDIYHAHLTYGIVFGALLKIPRLYTHHNAKMRVHRFVFRALEIWVDQLVAISEVCGSLLNEHAGRDVTVIRNGVDISRIFQKRVSVDPPGSSVRCVAVGAISEQKNYCSLVSAVERLPDSVRAQCLVSIAGEGTLDKTVELRETIVRAGLEDSVELLGNVSDIPALLNQSHLFVMSSAWEGLPIALIEAACAGLPCIVTDVGGCREVIDTCRNGLVVAPGNIQALADAIEHLLQTPAELTAYSDNALQYAHVFSIEHAGQAHVCLYEKLLSPLPNE